MACDSGCVNCSTTGGELHVETSFSPPKIADPGAQVTIKFKVVMNSMWSVDTWFWACLYNTDTDLCETSTPQTFIDHDGVDVTLTYLQPTDGDFHGVLSIAEWQLIGSNQCDDIKAFTVKTNFPPVAKWACNTKTKSCARDDISGTYMTATSCNDACKKSGAGTAVVCDPNNDMNIMGICVPKPIVLGAFVLGAIYIFKG